MSEGISLEKIWNLPAECASNKTIVVVVYDCRDGGVAARNQDENSGDDHDNVHDSFSFS